MNTESQRIAIAEAANAMKPTGDEPHWNCPKCGKVEPSRVTFDERHDVEDCMMPVRWVSIPTPDYLNDLNAMHEAEKVLTEAQHYEYAGTLGYVAQADLEGGDLSDLYAITHATAAQRAEAFLRTIGKWVE